MLTPINPLADLLAASRDGGQGDRRACKSRLLILALFALSVPSQASAKSCTVVDRPVAAQHAARGDVALGEAVATSGVWNLRLGEPLQAGLSVVRVEPTMSAAKLSDGQVLIFVEDGTGSSAISFVRRAREECLKADVDFAYSYPLRGRDIILSPDPIGPQPRVGIRRSGGLTRIVSISGGGASTVRTLLTTRRRIDAIGVSIPAIEAGTRSLMTVTRETDGSFTVGRYEFAPGLQD